MVYLLSIVLLTMACPLWKASALSKMSHQFHRGARAARRIQMWQQARQLHICPTRLSRHRAPCVTACILQRAPCTSYRQPSSHVFTGQIRHGRRYRCNRRRRGGHCASFGGCDGPGRLGRRRRHGGRRGRGGRIQSGPHRHPLSHWGRTELEFELSQAGRQRARRLGTSCACVRAEKGERAGPLTTRLK